MSIEYKTYDNEIKEFDDENLIITHFISTERQDRGGDIMRVSGMKIKGKPVVLYQHGRDDKIGKEAIAKNLSIKADKFKNRPGILAKTQFYPDEIGKRFYDKNKNGYMPNWSIGFIPLRVEELRDGGRDVIEWDLLEYSLVAVPMQADAQTLSLKFVISNNEKDEKPYANEHACRLKDPKQFDNFKRENDKFGKGIDADWGIKENTAILQAIRFDSEEFTEKEAKSWLEKHDYKCLLFEPALKKEGDNNYKAVIPYKKTPLSPESEKWDEGEERKKAEVSDLKVMAVYVDKENSENKTAYKGLHHKAGGEHSCVWNGVRALAAVIMGARGGMKVPAEDMSGIKKHVGNHYKDFDKGSPPWESREYQTFKEIIDILEDDEAKITLLNTIIPVICPDYKEYFNNEEYNNYLDKFIKYDNDIKEIKDALSSLFDLLGSTTKEDKSINNNPSELSEPKKLKIVDDKIKFNTISEILSKNIDNEISEVINKIKGKIPLFKELK